MNISGIRLQTELSKLEIINIYDKTYLIVYITRIKLIKLTPRSSK
jgi:hypothetical protein